MSRIPHTVRIRIPDAQHVALVGDFNNWHTAAHPLVQVGEDLWERIIDLSPGKYRYAFFVLNDSQKSGDDASPGQGSGAGAALRSRVIGNGSVLWVPEDPEQALSITAHPGLALKQVA